MKEILYAVAMGLRKPVEALDKGNGWRWLVVAVLAFLFVPGILREIF